MSLIGVHLYSQEPDYAAWTGILRTHYNQVEGMDYDGLANKDWAAIKHVVQSLGQVDTSRLNRDEQLAYYINLYNVTVVNLLMENRQVNSIRDLSTDPIIRFNIFKKDLVQMKGDRKSVV